MLTLYHNPQSRSTTVHTMLHEIGEPFELVAVDLKAGEQKSDAFLKINPMGKIPVLLDGDLIVTETPAILTYLADRYPDAGLAPAIDDPDRAAYLRWLFFAGSCFEPAAIDKALNRETPSSMGGWGTPDDVFRTLAAALKPGPWLLGERFTAADVMMGSGVAYMLGFKIIPEWPEFVDYAARIEARPARQAAKAADEARAGG
ncbi:glutathione S-transferase [Hyphomicrobium nitrativorans NL23]|uniref:Glutathione S-transferase n=1 Tax=Hyphomicrobium nitrativorans NL23 TaxID=1029756 RepID=V5SI15_9HYPH|nr:glutathione S-transferase family protein [Hyphomicrobium nitrativorans]AHB49584.1 glutathione S-transferase [Hyphomicrobium nitrativorans NL23]